MRIVEYLEFYARTCPEKVFIYQKDGSEQISYAEFWESVVSKAKELAGQGYKRGQILCVRASQDAEYLSLYFACHYAGIVIAPLEHDLPAERLEAIRSRVDGIEMPEQASDILFTSGTTGSAKAVVLSHEALVADADNLTESQGFHHDLTFIINGPINHFGNHSKVLPVVKNGGSLYFMDNIKSLDSVFQALDFLQARGPVGLFLVPASIRMLLQWSGTRLSEYAKTIEFIETGAAPISQSDMLALVRLLPGSRLYNTYASSETGVVSTYNYNDGETLVSCVGHPMTRSHVSICDGVIVCSGDAQMMGYLGESLSEHPAPIVTSDMGRLDEKGRLYLTGRSGDIINVGGLKVSPVEVEDAALGYAAIRDCICIAAPHRVMGYVPKLLYVVAEGTELDKRDLARYLKGKMEQYKVPVLYEQVDGIKRTYNGKLDRKAYKC